MNTKDTRINLECRNCGGNLEVDADREILSCPYCGSKDLLIQSDAVKIQKIKSKAYQEVEHERQETYKAVELGKKAYDMDMKKLDYAERKRNDKIVLFIILLLIMLSLGCFAMGNFLEMKEKSEHENEIQVTCDSKDYNGKNCEDVIENLKAVGFTNIEIEGLGDLVTGWLIKEGTVESVYIDGDDEFSEGDYFQQDANVKIIYHSFAEDE